MKRSLTGGRYLIGYWLLTLSLIVCCATVLCAQGDQESTPATKEKLRSRMSITASQYPDGTILLEGLLRVRSEGSFQKVPNAPVEFYRIYETGEEVLLGDTITAASGIAFWKISTQQDVTSAGLMFLARFDGSSEMTGSESDITIMPAILKITPAEEDGAQVVSVQALALTEEGEEPIADAVVSVYVKRMFSRLKIGDGTTDESGVAVIPFPDNLPGDAEAFVEITAEIEETDEYGNLVAEMRQPWGHPVSYAEEKLPRALWSPHPPIWMVVTFFVLMGTVWIHYAVVVYMLYRVKAEKTE